MCIRDSQYAILFIRGERPVLDFKYDILKHPNVALTADGKAGVYQHGAVRSDIATIEVTYLDPKTLPDTEVPETDYVLLSDEDAVIKAGFQVPLHQIPEYIQFITDDRILMV